VAADAARPAAKLVPVATFHSRRTLAEVPCRCDTVARRLRRAEAELDEGHAYLVDRKVSLARSGTAARP